MQLSSDFADPKTRSPSVTLFKRASRCFCPVRQLLIVSGLLSMDEVPAEEASAVPEPPAHLPDAPEAPRAGESDLPIAVAATSTEGKRALRQQQRKNYSEGRRQDTPSDEDDEGPPVPDHPAPKRARVSATVQVHMPAFSL